MFCPNCGSPVGEGLIFCSSCGCRLRDSAPNGEAAADAAQAHTPLPAAEEAPKKRKKQLHIAPSVILAILFGIFAYAAGTLSLVGSDLRAGLNNHAVSSELSGIKLGDVVVGDLLEGRAMEDIVEENEIILPRDAENATIAEVVALSVDVCDSNLSEDEVIDIIDKIKVSHRLADFAACYEDYILTGTYSDFRSGLAKEIKTIFKKYEEAVAKITGYWLADDYEKLLDKALADNKELLKGIMPDKVIGCGDITSVVLSPVCLIAAVAVCLLFLALSWIVTKRPGVFLMTGGVVFMLVGATSVGASVALSNLSEFPMLGLSVVEDVFAPILYSVFGEKLLYAGLIVIGLGVLMTAGFIVYKAVSRKKSPKADSVE